MPMQQHFTPSRSIMTENKSDRRSQRHQPRRITIERIRQFARVYQPVNQLPSSLCGIILN